MTTGCAACFGESAAGVWAARAGLRLVAPIVEEPHFSVRVLACAACGQEFVSVFCETIDWAGGEDPQDWIHAPVTRDEAQALVDAGARGVERALGGLSPERHLVRTFPSTASAPDVAWRGGPVLVPRHD